MDLQEFLNWTQKKGGVPRSYLLKPGSLNWPRDYKSAREEITSCLADIYQDSARDELFAFLLADCLMSPDRANLLQILNGVHDLRTCGLELSWRQILGCRWLGVPLAVADDRQGNIVYAFIGTRYSKKMNLPGVLGDMMDKDALQAVYTAVEFVQEDDFVFWVPFFFRTSIKGKSLGLPVYLALNLMHRLDVWPQLVCTGNLDSDGNLQPVAGMEHKAGAAREHGFEGIMYPRQKELQMPDYLNVEMLPVSDTGMAQALVESYCPGKGRAQLFFYQERNNPDHAISNLCSVDLRLLRFFQEKEGYLRNRISPLLQEDNEAREKLINRLNESLDSKTQDLKQLYYILKNTFDLETARALCSSQPRQAFRIARMHMELMNHQGIIQGLDDWYGIAQESLKAVAFEKDVDDEELLVGIFAMVGGLQNSYLFIPDRAEEIIRSCKPALVRLEERFASRKEKMGFAVNDSLGRYYGTMAQHYGFCGPQHLDDCLFYCDLAQEAFGKGEYQGMVQDWKRAFSYRFFAWLDAGDPEKALSELVNYLKDPIEALDYDPLNKYEHFHLARFLAETEEAGHQYVKWSINALQGENEVIKPEHPWQLWTLNIGRLVQDPDIRKQFWKTSIDICRQNGPTMRVMALMPLSCLWAAGLDSPGQLSSQATRVLQDCRDKGLWEQHFEPLWSMSGDNVLAEVVDKASKYFPFSYR